MTYFNHTRTLFQYERATYNGVKGYFATRYIAGVYAGKQFGITRTAARNAFNNSERYSNV